MWNLRLLWCKELLYGGKEVGVEDNKIVDLFWSRSERAISETQKKYDKYCRYIANNILRDEWDSEECVSDAYVRLWELIPPNRPEKLSVFAAKIVRGLAIDRLRGKLAKKRGVPETELITDELAESLNGTDQNNIENGILLRDAINKFLYGLEKEKRIVFVRRYWYMSSIRDIALDVNMSEGNVKTTLCRLSLLKSRHRRKRFPRILKLCLKKIPAKR